jgi:hypothetical protein
MLPFSTCPIVGLPEKVTSFEDKGPFSSSPAPSECELMDDKASGIAVHIGARVAALAHPGEVLVSRTVKDLVAGSGIEFSRAEYASSKGLADGRCTRWLV